MDTLIIPGKYRTRCGGIVEIVGPHPRYPSLVVSSRFSEENPGAYWWQETGVHPHSDDNDLVERLP